jgi:hypothetical protein
MNPPKSNKIKFNNNNKLVEYFATATVKWGRNPKPHVRSSSMSE